MRSRHILKPATLIHLSATELIVLSWIIKTKMTTLTECGDILSMKRLTPFVRQSVKNIIEKEGFISYKVDVKDISTSGGNYMGTLQTVSIKGKSKHGTDKELNLFLKNILPIDDTFTLVNASMAYFREGHIYNKVLQLIANIEDKHNISQDERFNTVTSYSEANNEVIILEDVSKMGFKTCDRADVVPLKFAELAIEQLAKLHAMSFVIQNEYPKYFESNIKSLNTMYIFTSDLEIYTRKCFDKAMETLEGDAKSKLDKFYPKMINKMPKYLNFPAKKAIGLVHGDFRPNNILMKEIDGEVSKVIPVDYQLTHYGYPIIDFIYFIFFGTDQKFRKEHLEDLKNLYYSTFENFLSKFNIEASEVYSKNQFEEEYRDKLDFGIMVFLLSMPFIFAKTDNIPNLENGLQGTSFNMDERFKDRLHGIVDDFIEWGYL